MSEEFKKVPMSGSFRPRKTERSKEDLEFQLSLLQKRMHSPKVDLVESAEYFTVRMELPGLTSESIKVDLKDSHILLVSGMKQEVRYDGKIKYKECKYGNFMRRVKLPGQVEYNNQFTYENGVFTLHLNKVLSEQDSETVPTTPQHSFNQDFTSDITGESWADIQ